jgi:hypothetical protein
MIEWIIGGAAVIGISALVFYFRDKVWAGLKTGYAWFNKKFDRSKFDLDDITEIYEMMSEFISGGADGNIDAADAIILLARLEAWIASNKKDEAEDEVIILIEDEL